MTAEPLTLWTETVPEGHVPSAETRAWIMECVDAGRTDLLYAPLPGCRCAICASCRPVVLPDRGRPIRPSDPEWGLLLRLAKENEL